MDMFKFQLIQLVDLEDFFFTTKLENLFSDRLENFVLMEGKTIELLRKFSKLEQDWSAY